MTAPPNLHALSRVHAATQDEAAFLLLGSSTPLTAKENHAARPMLNELVTSRAVDKSTVPVFLLPKQITRTESVGPVYSSLSFYLSGPSENTSDEPGPRAARRDRWSLRGFPCKRIRGFGSTAKAVWREMADQLAARHGSTGIVKTTTLFTVDPSPRTALTDRTVADFINGGPPESGIPFYGVSDLPMDVAAWRSTSSQPGLSLALRLTSQLIALSLSDPTFKLADFRRDDNGIVSRLDPYPLGYCTVDDGEVVAVFSGMGCNAERLELMHDSFRRRFLAPEGKGRYDDMVAALEEGRTDFATGYMVL